MSINICYSHEEPKEEPQRKTQRDLGWNSVSTKSLAVNKILNSPRAGLEVLAKAAIVNVLYFVTEYNEIAHYNDA